MLDLQIISGTDRPGSYALRISRYLKKRYHQLDMDIIAGIIDLQDFPAKKVVGGKYGKKIPEVEAFVQPLLDADGLCIVVPEYNGGYPGILKLLIDYLPFPGALEKKPVSFVGEATGAFGAMRAVEQLQQVVGYRNAHVYPERVFIPRVNRNFDEENGIKDSVQQELLESQVHNFAQFMNDIKERNTVTG